MTILDYLRNNPGKHTATAIAKACVVFSEDEVRYMLTRMVKLEMIIGHEQHGKIVYEHKEPNT